jgi:hypothetical protein
MSHRLLQLGMIGLSLLATTLPAQDSGGIDPEALIERILAADQVQCDLVDDVTFEAEYIEREDKGDEGIKEKVRLTKKVYIKYFEDTAWYAEEFLEYYKDGELKSDEDLSKEAADRTEKKIKRKARDISFPMLRPFYPERRELYDIEYVGVAEERIDDYVCHHFHATAREPSDSLINGDYYFESETFRLVRVDFSPSKLVKKTMFKLKELKMSLRYSPNENGLWLPIQFDVKGKGKAAFFFGVNFAGNEYYRNPVINSGLDDSIFEVKDGD